MNVLQWNIHGLLNNYPELNILIKECNPDVIALQETHIPANKSIFAPNKYSSFFHNNPNNNHCKQGVAIFIKKSIQHKHIPVSSNIQTLAIELDIGFRLTIISCYIPPDQNFTTREILNILNIFATPIIFVGDVNAWSPLWGSTSTNKRGEIFEDIILSKSLIVLNDGAPTHFSTHKTFTNPDITFSSASIAPKLTTRTLDELHNSDHFPILTTISKPSINKLKPRAKFLIEKADWQKFSVIAINTSHQTPVSNNINAEAAAIKRIIRTAAHIAIPQSRPKISSAKLPYWNNLLSSLRNSKQSAWKEYKRNRTDDNLVKFKKANSIFRREFKERKRKAFKKLTANISPSSNAKKVWSDIKMLTSSDNRRHISFIHSTGGPIYEPVGIAEIFASTWSTDSHDSNFHSIFNSLKYNSISDAYTNMFPAAEAIYVDSPISIKEFDVTLSSMRGKTPGSDNITYTLLKRLPYSARLRLIDLYNLILDQGVFPQEWKIATVLPILKPSKSSSSIASYRPISLLSCLSKVFEKIISRRLLWYSEKNSLNNPHQFAFQKGLNVLDPLLIFEHYASMALSSGNHVSVLSLDFEKAYDRIGSHVILSELKRWKVGSKIFNVIKSFLGNRKFFVRVNNRHSKIAPLFNGIPQGSPLSVVLFSIAFHKISSIISSFSDVEHFIYADDIVIFSKVKDLTVIRTIFLKILTDLINWSHGSGAKLSVNKSSFFHICRKRRCTPPSLSLNDISVPNTDTLKILGIIFDKKLTFKQHCKFIRISLFYKLNIIKFLSSKHSFVSISTLINLTRVLLLAKIDFGLAIYGHCAKKHLQLLQSPYHTAVRRSIRAFPTSPIKAILAEAGLPEIQDRVLHNTMMLIKKILNCRNEYLFSFVQSSQQQKNCAKRPSTIARILSYIEQLGIISKPTLKQVISLPLSHLPDSVLISDLLRHPKENTSACVYRQLYLEATEFLRTDWEFLFTDGSRYDTSTSFAVANELGVTIIVGALPNYCSVYTAESAALLEAVRFASTNVKKYVICSDSKSTIDAVFNNTSDSYITSSIRDILWQNKNSIKIMWVPGHVGIKGNEYADQRAKAGGSEPIHLFDYIIEKDIKKLVTSHLQTWFSSKWIGYQHHYKNFNFDGTKPLYPSSISCNKIRTFVRLRIGHTVFSHSHLLKGTDKPPCPFCGSNQITVTHILDDCVELNVIRNILFKCNKPSELLKKTDENNINIIHKFFLARKLIV
uniref:Putative RNA-directed DNA polymerase from transposon X-element n=1 Tax=Ceratitis capitata TaxID=7213 RepID=W8BNQ0_CERCA